MPTPAPALVTTRLRNPRNSFCMHFTRIAADVVLVERVNLRTGLITESERMSRRQAREEWSSHRAYCVREVA